MASAGEVVREGQCRRAAAWAFCVLPVVSGSRIAGLGRPPCPVVPPVPADCFYHTPLRGRCLSVARNALGLLRGLRETQRKPESFFQTRKSSHHRDKSGRGILAGKGV